MPFTKHIIEPINISQCPLPPGEPNELECLSNLTLANVIRQLSSLGQHAGRIFDELSKDAVQLNNRALVMHQRIENLKGKCLQLDIQSEEVTLADFQTKKQFKSSIKIDQQVVSRKTMPEAMTIMYNNADPPPALDKLNPYRQDGKDCMKFYTDPEFFFNIWCNELIKDNETRKNEKKRRKSKQNDKQNHQTNNQNISRPMVINKEDAFYQQQQAILLNQNNPKINGVKQNYPQPSGYYPKEFDEQSLPLPPPLQQQQQPNMPSVNYEIYSEASQNMNGNSTLHRNQMRKNPAQIQQNNINNSYNNNPKIYSSERPVLPPPPVPSQNHLSDLQQIQQQMIKKKPNDYTVNNNNKGVNNGNNDNNGNKNNENGDFENNNCDLPPPPSPPSNLDCSNPNRINANNPQMYNQQSVTMTSQQLMKMNISENKTNDSSDFDMPLPPPPPLDLQDSSYNLNNLPPPIQGNQTNNGHHNNGNTNNGQGSLLPPPPPLPPLVESDTVSTASSASINNTPNIKSADTSKNDEVKVAKSSYLDDINQRRFQLKSSKKDQNSSSNGNNSIMSDGKENSDTIQPFVNNSDVAAIIDFIRKFRPHVRDSSEEDEENSDWDE